MARSPPLAAQDHGCGLCGFEYVDVTAANAVESVGELPDRFATAADVESVGAAVADP